VMKDYRIELKRYKIRSKSSMEDLATKIGVSRMTIHRWLTRKYGMSKLSSRRVIEIIGLNECPHCGRKL
jgi:transcriptional regulator with XRE-family HTH domain